VEAQTAKRNTDTALADVQQEYADMKRKYGASQDLVVTLRQQVQTLESGWVEAMEEVDLKNAELGALSSKMSDAHAMKRLAHVHNKLDTLQANPSKRDSTEQDSRLQDAFAEIAHLKGQVETLHNRMSQASRELDESKELLAQCRQVLVGKDQEIQGLSQQLTEEFAQRTAAVARCRSLQDELNTLAGEHALSTKRLTSLREQACCLTIPVLPRAPGPTDALK